MVHAFWQYLNTLQHSTTQATAEVNGKAVYGGNALQAFLVALKLHGTMVWQDLAGLACQATQSC